MMHSPFNLFHHFSQHGRVRLSHNVIDAALGNTQSQHRFAGLFPQSRAFLFAFSQKEIRDQLAQTLLINLLSIVIKPFNDLLLIFGAFRHGMFFQVANFRVFMILASPNEGNRKKIPSRITIARWGPFRLSISVREFEKFGPKLRVFSSRKSRQLSHDPAIYGNSSNCDDHQ
ncbi:hypothetical protein Pan258_23420 [Symmachiella dynata]|nr:hypothetical protein Pan258_23420 [Symmachiella dynata]